jgi:hypothetical protein
MCSVKYLRVYKLFFNQFLSSISHVVLLAPFCVSAAFPSPVLRANSFAGAAVLAELEERGVGSFSGYRLSSVEEF